MGLNVTACDSWESETKAKHNCDKRSCSPAARLTNDGNFIARAKSVGSYGKYIVVPSIRDLMLKLGTVGRDYVEVETGVNTGINPSVYPPVGLKEL